MAESWSHWTWIGRTQGWGVIAPPPAGCPTFSSKSLGPPQLMLGRPPHEGNMRYCSPRASRGLWQAVIGVPTQRLWLGSMLGVPHLVSLTTAQSLTSPRSSAAPRLRGRRPVSHPKAPLKDAFGSTRPWQPQLMEKPHLNLQPHQRLLSHPLPNHRQAACCSLLPPTDAVPEGTWGGPQPPLELAKCLSCGLRREDQLDPMWPCWV